MDSHNTPSGSKRLINDGISSCSLPIPSKETNLDAQKVKNRVAVDPSNEASNAGITVTIVSSIIISIKLIDVFSSFTLH